MELKKYIRFVGESNQDEDLENLLYLIRTFLKNKKSAAMVTNRGLDITIVFELKEKEKISTILNVFETAEHISKKLLPDHDVEFEIYTDSDGSKVVFDFFE